MEALRVGLVGYGGAGRGIHARLLREAGQRVTAVVTRSRAAQVEADWPGAAVEPDVHLVGTLLSLGGVLPERTRETARVVVRRVVDDIERRLRLRALHIGGLQHRQQLVDGVGRDLRRLAERDQRGAQRCGGLCTEAEGLGSAAYADQDLQ